MKKSTKTEWNMLNNEDDLLIDYSDIPATEPLFWADAKILIFKNKVDYTLKLDEDLAL